MPLRSSPIHPRFLCSFYFLTPSAVSSFPLSAGTARPTTLPSNAAAALAAVRPACGRSCSAAPGWSFSSASYTAVASPCAGGVAHLAAEPFPSATSPAAAPHPDLDTTGGGISTVRVVLAHRDGKSVAAFPISTTPAAEVSPWLRGSGSLGSVDHGPFPFSGWPWIKGYDLHMDVHLQQRSLDPLGVPPTVSWNK